jgi:hypothetical protein
LRINLLEEAAREAGPDLERHDALGVRVALAIVNQSIANAILQCDGTAAFGGSGEVRRLALIDGGGSDERGAQDAYDKGRDAHDEIVDRGCNESWS